MNQGMFSEVRRCLSRSATSNDVRAVKIIKKDICNPDEIEALKIVDHPNIVRLHQIFEDETSIHLVTEYCKGESLFDIIIHIDPFPE